ncbi:MAG TPA: molybdopterin-dependent oxidoreductase [Acidimicrobiales bacterium]|nr:molybdopterin-dependent oxidoreductase [Acidimicrobiales bacterium]
MCPALCGVRVTTDGGVVTRLTGDPDHPLSRGYLCPKGRKMATLTDDPERLDEPMVRGRGGKLVTVDWDTAVGDLADRLAGIRDRFGPYAIGNYSGTMFDAAGRFAATGLLAAIGSPSRYTSSTIDSVAKVLVAKLMSGREGLVPAVDFDTTTLLLVIGENMVVSHGGFSYFPDPIRYLRSIQRRGEVWVFDPRRTETARLATRHLSARSGTDFAFLGHVVRELLRDGADQEYLAGHALHLEELRRAVEPFDVPTAAGLTGLASEDLSALVAAVRRHRRLAIVTGTGVTMAATGNVTEWMAYAVQILTGSFERPGGRWFNHTAAVSPSSADAPDTSGFEPGPKSHPEIPRMANQYPCAVMAEEIEGGYVKGLLVTGGNPLTAFPQPGRLRRAFDQLDVLAVWDIVPSATAERATHLFPCPDPLERADLVVPIHLSMVFAQYTNPVVPARANRRPMWWSLAKVAERMGLSILPGGTGADACTDEQLFASMVAGTPVPWEVLVEAAGRPVQFPREEQWVERTVLRDGRWDLAPPLLRERLEHARSRTVPGLVLGNRREVQHTNSTLAWGLRKGSGPQTYVYLSPADAARAGVEHGDAVEVLSSHGDVRGTAQTDSAMAPGTVVVPHGFSNPHVGHLTATDVDIDPLTGMPTLVGVPVSVRPLNGSGSPGEAGGY